MSKLYDLAFSGRAAAWTAFATVMMMVFTGLLWHVNQIATETSIATQRAVLSTSGPSLQKVNTPDGKK